MVGAAVERELMAHVGAYAVSLQKPGQGRLMLMVEKPPGPVVTYDLRQGGFFSLIRDAFMTLLSDDQRILRVLGPSPQDSAIRVEVVLDEAPMRAAMLDYSKRILNLSLVISLFTAALVYLSLHRMIVRPMRRITQSMVSFRTNPQDASRDLVPSGRSDEVGVVERELVTMQEGLRGALLQKTRLAALGTAVSKINHDQHPVQHDHIEAPGRCQFQPCFTVTGTAHLVSRRAQPLTDIVSNTLVIFDKQYFHGEKCSTD